MKNTEFPNDWPDEWKQSIFALESAPKQPVPSEASPKQMEEGKPVYGLPPTQGAQVIPRRHSGDLKIEEIEAAAQKALAASVHTVAPALASVIVDPSIAAEVASTQKAFPRVMTPVQFASLAAPAVEPVLPKSGVVSLREENPKREDERDFLPKRKSRAGLIAGLVLGSIIGIGGGIGGALMILQEPQAPSVMPIVVQEADDAPVNAPVRKAVERANPVRQAAERPLRIEKLQREEAPVKATPPVAPAALKPAVKSPPRRVAKPPKIAAPRAKPIPAAKISGDDDK